MKISILTLFPDMFAGPFDTSIVKRARDKKLVDINFVNIRSFGIGKHKSVDDTPYGGGIGMVMRFDVLHKAITHTKETAVSAKKQKIVLLDAGGEQFTQQKAKEYARLSHLILVCGHYEGVDERIKQYVDEEISIGDFILTGGELPAMLITDSVVRQINGVFKAGVTDNESFSEQFGEKSNRVSLLEYPQYTQPRTFQNKTVPPVLLSGDHKKIAKWRKQKAFLKTKQIRPDLLKKIKKDPRIYSRQRIVN